MTAVLFLVQFHYFEESIYFIEFHNLFHCSFDLLPVCVAGSVDGVLILSTHRMASDIIVMCVACSPVR